MKQRNEQKKGKGGKGGNRKKQESEEEEDVEEDKEEEKVIESKPSSTKAAALDMPIDVIYCRVCGIPPEYCMFDKKDSSECKEWLKKTHPELFEKVYGETIVQAAEGQSEAAAAQDD